MREWTDRTPSTRHSLKTDCKIDGKKTANHNMNSECDNIVSTPGGKDLQESLVAGGSGSNTRSNGVDAGADGQDYVSKTLLEDGLRSSVFVVLNTFPKTI